MHVEDITDPGYFRSLYFISVTYLTIRSIISNNKHLPIKV